LKKKNLIFQDLQVSEEKRIIPCEKTFFSFSFYLHNPQKNFSPFWLSEDLIIIITVITDLTAYPQQPRRLSLSSL